MGEVKQYSMEEVKSHKNKDSAWCVYKNVIYDVTKFLDEHPGGVEQLLDVCGNDITSAFEDVGHSVNARLIMKKYKIGELKIEDRTTKDRKSGGKCCVIV